MEARTIRSLQPGEYVLREAQVRVEVQRGRFTKSMRMNGQNFLISAVLREDNNSWDVTYTLNGSEVHDVLIEAAT